MLEEKETSLFDEEREESVEPREEVTSLELTTRLEEDKPASEDEDFAEKQARFKQESTERMEKICLQIGYLERIAKKRSVEYTQENVEKMFAYLEAQLAECKETYMEKFERKNKKFDFEF